MPPQDDKTQRRVAPAAQPVLHIEEDTVPDSLVRARWRIQRTAPIETADLDTSALDLRFPENIRQQVEYDDSLNVYKIGSKIGDTYLNTPVLMTPEEYQQWSERRERALFFRKKDAENVAAKGKEKFDFSDMHFDLGPAEKIFGPGGVRIRTQGTAELKLGATLKNIDNPSLPERNRKTTAVDFDEKINLNVTGKVGDKVNMSLNYNTDATFDFDTKNLKLRYEGKEDEIIKLVEAGNITFPSNNTLVKGASSLFGVRTDMQFGKLKLQTVFSQKNSTTKSVSSQGGTQLTPFEIDAAVAQSADGYQCHQGRGVGHQQDGNHLQHAQCDSPVGIGREFRQGRDGAVGIAAERDWTRHHQSAACGSAQHRSGDIGT